MSMFNHNVQRKQVLGGVNQHVYGPYDDFSFFDPKTFPPTGCIPSLTDVELYLNKKQIGFDDTEYINTPPRGSDLQSTHDILLFGVIEVQSLDWLLPQARIELQEDLRESNNTYGLRSGEGSTLKVRIACSKRLLANVLSKNYPGALIVCVATENRNFAIRSMHPVTMSRSIVFLERSYLRLLIRKFIEEDAQKTPLAKRDLNWLTDHYYNTELPQVASSNLRYIRPARDIPSISNEPRHVRHLAHAHIRGVFAEHADWLLAVQIATASKNSQLLDIPSWIAFCHEAQEDSLDAHKSGYKWGIFHSGTKSVNTRFEKLAIRLARFGDTKEEWERRLKNAIRRATKRKQKSPTPAPEEAVIPDNTFQFDSDFSEASTEYNSDGSSSELDFRIPLQIPPFLFRPPVLPAGSFDWRCPSPSCNFGVDLLSVPASQLAKLSQHEQQLLVSKHWTVNDNRIQDILGTLVSDHYEGHLSSLGFSLSQTSPNKWKLGTNSTESPVKSKIKKEESNRNTTLLP